ncbi:MAG: hypothetical protein U5K38_05675 [Woeseiaceae bacterium]|nr:hypothetical protein [Woeseiaceae bacterium]
MKSSGLPPVLAVPPPIVLRGLLPVPVTYASCAPHHPLDPVID